MYTSQIYLTKKYVTKEEWLKFINVINKYLLFLSKWQIFVIFNNNIIHYYVKTNINLPPSINGLDSFILKRCENIKNKSKFSFLYFSTLGCSATDLYNKFSFHNARLNCIVINFQKITNDKFISNTFLYTDKRNYKLILGIPNCLLSIDFNSNYNLLYQSPPKYIDVSKSIHLLTSDNIDSILKVDAFPYMSGNYFLKQSKIDFAKHSIIFGSSGSGKSKFLSLLIYNICKKDIFKNKYKIIVIDPHASLEKEIGGVGKVIDFISNSINLFNSNSDDVIVSVELLLDIFKSLISDNYNSKLERVLRYCLNLLLTSLSFSFNNLRKVLLETDYRNQLLKKYEDILPFGVISFFLTEFNNIKTSSYTEAISPIISLIDEVTMLPVFNREIDFTLEDAIRENLLTIISLNRQKLGSKITKTISCLIMQQLFQIMQNYTFDEHIILVIDEVAVVENPILNRFLSESRKYNLSLILIGQYFNGISNNLKQAIFANVINYYIFRLSKDDASLLVDNINMKIPLDDSKEQKIKLFTELQNRECIVRISSNDILFPAFKCETLDFQSIPRIKKETISFQDKKIFQENSDINFNINNINLNELLNKISTSRGNDL